MQAVILAAGVGKRMKSLTANAPKCMAKVGDETFIQRILYQLEKYNLSNIYIVVGYKKDVLEEYINTLNIKTPITYVLNADYANSNNIVSLALAMDIINVQEPVVLFESDLILTDNTIAKILKSPNSCCILSKYNPQTMSGTCVKLLDKENIDHFVYKENQKSEEVTKYYKTVNCYKFNPDYIGDLKQALDETRKELGDNVFYEKAFALNEALTRDKLKVAIIEDIWYEVDTGEELNQANKNLL